MINESLGSSFVQNTFFPEEFLVLCIPCGNVLAGISICGGSSVWN